MALEIINTQPESELELKEIIAWGARVGLCLCALSEMQTCIVCCVPAAKVKFSTLLGCPSGLEWSVDPTCCLTTSEIFCCNNTSDGHRIFYNLCGSQFKAVTWGVGGSILGLSCGSTARTISYIRNSCCVSCVENKTHAVQQEQSEALLQNLDDQSDSEKEPNGVDNSGVVSIFTCKVVEQYCNCFSSRPR